MNYLACALLKWIIKNRGLLKWILKMAHYSINGLIKIEHYSIDELLKIAHYSINGGSLETMPL